VIGVACSGEIATLPLEALTTMCRDQHWLSDDAGVRFTLLLIAQDLLCQDYACYRKLCMACCGQGPSRVFLDGTLKQTIREDNCIRLAEHVFHRGCAYFEDDCSVVGLVKKLGQYLALRLSGVPEEEAVQAQLALVPEWWFDPAR